MATVIDLGQKVKQKYPGVYDDMPDVEVGRKVKEKYTEYSDFEDVQEQPVAHQPPKKGLVEKTADFLGSGTLGRAFGGVAAYASGAYKMQQDAQMAEAEARARQAKMLNDPNTRPESREHLQSQLSQGAFVQSPLDDKESAINLTPKQIYGSAVQTAGLLLPSAIGKAGAGAKLGEKVARTVGAGMLTGAALAGGKAAEENKGAMDIVGGAAKGALLVGAIGGVGELALKGVGALAGKSANRLAGSALKETVGQTKKAIQYGGETTGQIAVRRGVVGTDNQILARAKSEMEAAENKLQAALQPNTNRITREEIRNSKPVRELINRLKKTIGGKKDAQMIEEIVNEAPKSVRVATANERKRLLYQELGDVAYKLDPSLSKKKEALKAIAKGYKQLIEEKSIYTAGKGTVRKLNIDLSEWGKLRDAAVDNLARGERNQILGLGNLGAIGTGAVLGGPAGAIAGSIVRNILGSTWGKTAGAYLLNRISKAILEVAPKASEKVAQQIKKLPVETVSKMSDATLKNIIKDLSAI